VTPGIVCPRCERTDRWEVIDSRPSAGTIRRRRECSCGLRITTHEVHVEQLDDLHKMHGSILQLHQLASDALKSATLFNEAGRAFRVSRDEGSP
jgi:transcriptional regulator NrdR family protein